MTVILPEINFLSTDSQELSQESIRVYEEFEGRKLAQADPLRLIFLSFASVITKQNIAINDAAKQNLLYYARGGVLDHKGAGWDTPRLREAAATTTLRMHLSVPLTSSKIIKKGELLATSNEAAIFFVSVQDVVIESGVTSVDVDLRCTIFGVDGNGFAVSQINTLVKPFPYIDYVENITQSDGGVERESDEPYRERVHIAPEKLSNAGPTGAYEYYAKSASALIDDVFVDTPSPGCVHISILLKNGKLPTQEILDDVYEKVSAREVRPLTDFVSVGGPTFINSYNLEIEYFIETNAVDKSLIHTAVEKAVDDFVTWQSSRLGRDINPSRLIGDCMRAGAKRVNVLSPVFTVIQKGELAQVGDKAVTFGGVEDD